MARADAYTVHDGLLRAFGTFRSRWTADPEEPGGVSDHQARILRQLDDRDPTMVGELADFMGVAASTMSLNLKRLEEGGFVERRRDPDDRRVVNVRLTERGRRVRDRSSPLAVSAIDAGLATLRPGERRRVLDGLVLLGEAADRLRARGDAYLEALAGASHHEALAGASHQEE